MATINDVSALAGVSVATVSRVINGSTNVSPETAEKVTKAIKELNYRPNLLGRDLRRTKSERVLVLLPNISNPFYSGIVKGIEDIAICRLTESDVVRHRIVQSIIKAYEEDEGRRKTDKKPARR